MEVCFEVRLEEDCTSVMSSLTITTIDFASFSAESPSHDSERHNGKPIPNCEHCKKQWHTKEQCWKLHGRPPEIRDALTTKNKTRGGLMLVSFPAPLSHLRIPIQLH